MIGPDGALREPDEIAHTREGHAEGNKTWYYIGRDDVAISWHGDTTVELAHVPAGGANAAQLQAIARIETEDLRFHAGFFGLDPEIRSRQMAVELAVATAVPICPACGKPVVTQGRYWDLVGDDGIDHCGQDVVTAFIRRSGPGKPMSRRCFGRDAILIRTVFTPQGDVEMLVYMKHGTHNVTFRLSPLESRPSYEPVPEQVLESVPDPVLEPASEQPSTPSLEEGLCRLLGRFGPGTSLSSVGRVPDEKDTRGV